MNKKEKREPIPWETYHSKDWSELTVQNYSKEKQVVIYYKHWQTFTTRLRSFMQKLPKEEKL